MLVRSRAPGRSSSPGARLRHLSLALPAALLLVPFVLVVTVGGLWIATHGENLLEPGSGENFVGVDNFAQSVADPTLGISIGVTVAYVVAAVLCETALGVGVALLMRKHFWGKGVVRSLVLIPMVLTPVVAGLTWRLLMDPTGGSVNYLLGLLGLGSDHAFLADPATALAAVILVDVWQNTPYVVIIVLAGLESLPPEPFEAAQLDGATGWKLFRNVTFPMLGPVLSIVVLLRAIDAVKTFALTQTMTKGGPGTSTLAISNYVYRVGFETFDIGYSSALGLVTSIALVVLIFPFARRLMVGDGLVREGRP